MEQNESVRVSKGDFQNFLKSMAMDEGDFKQYSKEIAMVLLGKIKNIISAYEEFNSVYKDINPYTAALLNVGVIFGIRFMDDKVCLGINGDPDQCKEIIQDTICSIFNTDYKEKRYEGEDNNESN